MAGILRDKGRESPPETEAKRKRRREGLQVFYIVLIVGPYLPIWRWVNWEFPDVFLDSLRYGTETYRRAWIGLAIAAGLLIGVSLSLVIRWIPGRRPTPRILHWLRIPICLILFAGAGYWIAQSCLGRVSAEVVEVAYDAKAGEFLVWFETRSA